MTRHRDRDPERFDDQGNTRPKGSNFPSAILDTGQRYSVTLTKPGSYDYFCSLHPRCSARSSSRENGVLDRSDRP
jgi:hypothetical protein